MGGETEFFLGHAHGDSVELAEVQHRDVESKGLLGGIELQVAERADVDDELVM